MNENNLEKMSTIEPKLDQEIKKEDIKALESWPKLMTGQEENLDMANLENDQIKEALYKPIEDRLDETIKILGIDVDNDLIEKINQTEKIEERVEMQKELIGSIARQINFIEDGKWAFCPVEIERQRKINCSGATMLVNHILNRAGIETEYGNPVGHAIGFAKLADDSLFYIDARNGLVKKIKAEEIEIEGQKVKKIDDKDIWYKLIPVFSNRDSVISVLRNMESLKMSAEDGDAEAKKIYEDNRSLFDATNYLELSEKLYPEATKLSQTDEWKQEEATVANIEQQTEKKKIFYKNLGISFQGEEDQKIEDQLDLIKKNNIKETQLRFKSVEDLEKQKSLIEKFRKENPDKNLSFHLSSNLEKINQELELAKAGDLVTVHPPTGKIREYFSLDLEQRKAINEQAIKLSADFISKHGELSFAIENMGQNPEEMKSIVGGIRAELIMKYGFDASKAEKSVGITFDINHALIDVAEKGDEEKMRIIEQWLKELKNEIKCFHFAVPDTKEESDIQSFQQRFARIKELYIEQDTNVPFFLETKRDLKTTQETVDLARNIIKK